MAKRNKKYNLIYGVITIITIIALSFIGEKVSSDNMGNLANEVNAGANEITTKIVETYFIPYVKPLKNNGMTSFSRLGYSGMYALNGKTDENLLGHWRYIIFLSNGTIVAFSMDGHCYGEEGTNENGNWYCTDYRNTNIYIVVDINGKKHPNTLGKDVFVMSVNSSTNKFEFYNYSNTANDRNWLLRVCNKNATDDGGESRHCSRVIQLDGWKTNYDW